MIRFFEHLMWNVVESIVKLGNWMAGVGPDTRDGGSGLLHFTPQSGPTFPTWFWVGAAILCFVVGFLRSYDVASQAR